MHSHASKYFFIQHRVCDIWMMCWSSLSTFNMSVKCLLFSDHFQLIRTCNSQRNFSGMVLFYEFCFWRDGGWKGSPKKIIFCELMFATGYDIFVVPSRCQIWNFCISLFNGVKRVYMIGTLNITYFLFYNFLWENGAFKSCVDQEQFHLNIYVATKTLVTYCKIYCIFKPLHFIWTF